MLYILPQSFIRFSWRNTGRLLPSSIASSLAVNYTISHPFSNCTVHSHTHTISLTHLSLSLSHTHTHTHARARAHTHNQCTTDLVPDTERKRKAVEFSKAEPKAKAKKTEKTEVYRLCTSMHIHVNIYVYTVWLQHSQSIMDCVYFVCTYTTAGDVYWQRIKSPQNWWAPQK